MRKFEITRFTLFKSDPFGHGGEKRTAQITELLLEVDIKWRNIPTGMEPRRFSIYYIKKCFRLITLFTKVYGITRKWIHPLIFYRTLKLVSQFTGVLDLEDDKSSKVILWEATKMEFSYVIPLFKEKGFKIVAVPHNIESFVPGLKSGLTNRTSPNWLMEEVAILKKCDKVFVISKEESLLLRQFGVNAQYFPYFPPVETFEYLIKIRKNRTENKKVNNERKKILMLGSAINAPTKEGMIDRINFFNENIYVKSYDLIIAGYGTKELELPGNYQHNIRLLGELTNHQLADVLTATDILLIHQPATAGALTRIIEMLIAGIPILSNFESGRNYYGTDGLYIYYNDTQLINYLETGNFPVPEIPDKPRFEIESFQETILKIA